MLTASLLDTEHASCPRSRLYSRELQLPGMPGIHSAICGAFFMFPSPSAMVPKDGKTERRPTSREEYVCILDEGFHDSHHLNGGDRGQVQLHRVSEKQRWESHQGRSCGN